MIVLTAKVDPRSKGILGRDKVSFITAPWLLEVFVLAILERISTLISLVGEQV